VNQFNDFNDFGDGIVLLSIGIADAWRVARASVATLRGEAIRFTA
jgi:hypothetical protein